MHAPGERSRWNRGKGCTEGSQACNVGIRSICAGVDTFKRKTTLMGKLSVKFDFFANGGLVFAHGLCDGRFGRAIDNTGEDDTALL